MNQQLIEIKVPTVVSGNSRAIVNLESITKITSHGGKALIHFSKEDVLYTDEDYESLRSQLNPR